MRRAARWALPLLLALALYAPTLRFGVLRDDAALILDRAAELGSLANLPRYFTEGFWPSALSHNAGDFFYRPLVTLLNVVNLELAGPTLWAFHLVNVLLHALNVMLLFLVIRRLAGDGAALFGACLFAAHPGVALSVAWISDRTDLLCTTLLLGSFVLWLRYREQRKTPALACSVALYFLALLAKELALPYCVLIGCFTLLDATDRETGKSRVVRFGAAAPYLLAAGVYLVIRSRVLTEDQLFAPPSLASRVIPALALFGHYVMKMIVPAPILYLPNAWEIADSTVDAVAGAGALLLGLAFAIVRRERALSLGLLWILLFLIPVLNLVPISYPGASYYLYLPLAGLALALAPAADWIAARLARPGRCALAVVVAAAAVANAATLSRFNSLGDLCRYDLERDPDNFKALMSCGETAEGEGDYPLANGLLGRAYRIRADDPILLFNYALSFHKLGDLRNAESLYRKALDREAGLDQAQENLGMLLADQNRCDEALPLLRRAQAARPNERGTTIGLMACDNLLGRFGDALEEFERAAPAVRRSAALLVTRGNALMGLHRDDEAARSFEDALALDPKFAPAHQRLSALYQSKGDTARAEEHQRRYLELSRAR